ncbi:unnamed protein product, partial [Diplocarpon coronariae]
LRPVKTSQTLKMLALAHRLNLGSDDGLDPAFDQLHRRRFLVFCENGTTWGLLQKRVADDPTSTPPPQKWDHIVHFDDQPADCDYLGDVGAAERVDLKEEFFIRYQNIELLGQQLTERWDFTDWYTRTPPSPWLLRALDPDLPFLQKFELNGAAAQDYTFGWELRAYEYSMESKDLVYECFYETPAFRPNIVDKAEPMDVVPDFAAAEVTDIVSPFAPVIGPAPVIAPAPVARVV